MLKASPRKGILIFIMVLIGRRRRALRVRQVLRWSVTVDLIAGMEEESQLWMIPPRGQQIRVCRRETRLRARLIRARCASERHRLGRIGIVGISGSAETTPETACDCSPTDNISLSELVFVKCSRNKAPHVNMHELATAEG